MLHAQAVLRDNVIHIDYVSKATGHNRRAQATHNYVVTPCIMAAHKKPEGLSPHLRKHIVSPQTGQEPVRPQNTTNNQLAQVFHELGGRNAGAQELAANSIFVG